MAYGKNVIGSTLSEMYAGSSNQKIFDYKGRLQQGGNTIFSSDGGVLTGIPQYTETLVGSTVAASMTPSTMTPYGVSMITSTHAALSSNVGVAYLGAPLLGVEKTIILKSTVAGHIVDIGLSPTSAVTMQGTTGNFIGFSTLGSGYQAITLMGLSTDEWAVKSINSTVGGFGAATGIRQLTAARTS